MTNQPTNTYREEVYITIPITENQTRRLAQLASQKKMSSSLFLVEFLEKELCAEDDPIEQSFNYFTIPLSEKACQKLQKLAKEEKTTISVLMEIVKIKTRE